MGIPKGRALTERMTVVVEEDNLCDGIPTTSLRRLTLRILPSLLVKGELCASGDTMLDRAKTMLKQRGGKTLASGKIALDIERYDEGITSGRVPLSWCRYWLVFALNLIPGASDQRGQCGIVLYCQGRRWITKNWQLSYSNWTGGERFVYIDTDEEILTPHRTAPA